MRNKKRLGFALIGIGAVLLTAALLLFLHNRSEDKRADASARAVLAAMQETDIPAATETTAAPGETEAETTAATEGTAQTTAAATGPVKELPRKTVEGHDYLGKLTFPTLELELPLIELIYLEDLQLAPGLQKGSPYSDDAVISGHNYPSQLGALKDLQPGDSVVFTDNDGASISYKVHAVKTLDPKETEAILNSPHPMVIYTCTPGGGDRVLAELDRA